MPMSDPSSSTGPVAPGPPPAEHMHSHILTPALTTRIRAQRLAPAADPSAGAFHANLAAALNDRRAAHSLRTIVPPDWQSSSLTPESDNNPQQSKKIDFASNDILSFNATGQLYHHFLSELTTANPPGVNINIGSTGSRLLDGDSLYLSQTEQLIATFHHAETGLLCSSGYDANVAVWTAIPRPGDVVLYDALVHASTHAGIARSLAMEKFEFKHGDVEDFGEVLGRVVREQGLVRAGRRSVLVAVEAVYSMDGDVCPLREMVEVAREVCGTEELRGSVQFVVDEAHSTGLLGEKGEGLVSALGLEKEIAVRVHTFGKCMGASGAIVLGSSLIKTALINFANSVIFTTAPPFPLVATIRASYALLQSEQGQAARERVQHVVRFFYEELTSHPAWHTARERGLLSVPLADDWDSRAFQSHISTVWTRPQYMYWLYFHLHAEGYCVWPIEHPVVPIGQSRIKVSFHAANTDEQVQGLVDAIFDWVEEVTANEEGRANAKVTHAASVVYEWMRSEGLDGFGMV